MKTNSAKRHKMRVCRNLFFHSGRESKDGGKSYVSISKRDAYQSKSWQVCSRSVQHQQFGVAKGMGNGFPIGGLLISPMFTPVYGMLGTTFGGNHLACTAAIAVLDIMEKEALVDNAARVGTWLIEQLKQLPGIKEVRGRGLMIGIEFDESIKELRTSLLFDYKVFTGVAGTNVIRLLPPLTFTIDDAAEFMERFKKVLSKKQM